MNRPPARGQLACRSRKTRALSPLQFAIASVVSAFYFLRSLDSDILGTSRNLKIFYYYCKFCHQRLWAHRKQRSSRQVTTQRQTRTRDQASYHHPTPGSFDEM